jgi:fused signal recognition particle receptor
MLFAVIIAIAAVVLIGASAFVLLRDRNDGLLIEDRSPTEVESAPAGDTLVEEAPVTAPPLVEDAPRPSFRERLATARSALGGYLGSVFTSGKISGNTWDELEEALIRADVGVATSTSIIDAVREKVAAGEIEDTAELPALVKAEIVERLSGFDRSLSTDVVAAGGEPGPAVWLFVGVNGVGKTTTIGKLASREAADGRSLVLAAGDTFRAAAAQQLTMWAARSTSCGAPRAPTPAAWCSTRWSGPTPAAPRS